MNLPIPGTDGLSMEIFPPMFIATFPAWEGLEEQRSVVTDDEEEGE